MATVDQIKSLIQQHTDHVMDDLAVYHAAQLVENHLGDTGELNLDAIQKALADTQGALALLDAGSSWERPIKQMVHVLTVLSRHVGATDMAPKAERAWQASYDLGRIEEGRAEVFKRAVKFLAEVLSVDDGPWVAVRRALKNGKQLEAKANEFLTSDQQQKAAIKFSQAAHQFEQVITLLQRVQKQIPPSVPQVAHRCLNVVLELAQDFNDQMIQSNAMGRLRVLKKNFPYLTREDQVPNRTGLNRTLETARWLGIPESAKIQLLGKGKLSWNSHLTSNKVHHNRATQYISSDGVGSPHVEARPTIMILGAGNAIDIPEIWAEKYHLVYVDLAKEAMEKARARLPKHLQKFVDIEVRDVSGGVIMDVVEVSKKIIKESPNAGAALEAFSAYLDSYDMQLPDLPGEWKSVDMIVSSQLISQMGVLAIRAFVVNWNQSHPENPLADDILNRQEVKMFVGRVTQTHLQALENYVNEYEGIASVSSEVVRTQTLLTPPFDEIIVHQVLFNEKGEPVHSVRDLLSYGYFDESYWHWMFAIFGDSPETRSAVQEIAPELIGLPLDTRSVEGFIIIPQDETDEVPKPRPTPHQPGPGKENFLKHFRQIDPDVSEVVLQESQTENKTETVVPVAVINLWYFIQKWPVDRKTYLVLEDIIFTYGAEVFERYVGHGRYFNQHPERFAALVFAYSHVKNGRWKLDSEDELTQLLLFIEYKMLQGFGPTRRDLAQATFFEGLERLYEDSYQKEKDYFNGIMKAWYDHQDYLLTMWTSEEGLSQQKQYDDIVRHVFHYLAQRSLDERGDDWEVSLGNSLNRAVEEGRFSQTFTREENELLYFNVLWQIDFLSRHLATNDSLIGRYRDKLSRHFPPAISYRENRNDDFEVSHVEQLRQEALADLGGENKPTLLIAGIGKEWSFVEQYAQKGYNLILVDTAQSVADYFEGKKLEMKRLGETHGVNIQFIHSSVCAEELIKQYEGQIDFIEFHYISSVEQDYDVRVDQLLKPGGHFVCYSPLAMNHLGLAGLGYQEVLHAENVPSPLGTHAERDAYPLGSLVGVYVKPKKQGFRLDDDHAEPGGSEPGSSLGIGQVDDTAATFSDHLANNRFRGVKSSRAAPVLEQPEHREVQPTKKSDPDGTIEASAVGRMMGTLLHSPEAICEGQVGALLVHQSSNGGSISSDGGMRALGDGNIHQEAIIGNTAVAVQPDFVEKTRAEQHEIVKPLLRLVKDSEVKRSEGQNLSYLKTVNHRVFRQWLKKQFRQLSRQIKSDLRLNRRERLPILRALERGQKGRARQLLRNKLQARVSAGSAGVTPHLALGTSAAVFARTVRSPVMAMVVR